jgi:hypothetical protein
MVPRPDALEPWPQSAKELLARVTGDASFGDYAAEVYLGLHGLLVSKQADYGARAVNEAPGGALHGVLVRAHDKYERLRHLEHVTDPHHESVRDTWADLANYAVIALMLLDGTWPQ